LHNLLKSLRILTMKFSLAFSALSFLSVSLSNVSGERQHIGSSVWSLSNEGVKIYLASTFEKIPNPDEGLYFDAGKTCSFKDAASDGFKYVWAISACVDEAPKLNLFDLNTGQFSASLPLTCPRTDDQKYPTLDYHASRKEMWVHCNGVGSLGAYGDVDAFSVNDLISDGANIASPTTSYCSSFKTVEACNRKPWPYESYCNNTATPRSTCEPLDPSEAAKKIEADKHEIGDFITSVDSGNMAYATLPAAGNLLQINLSAKSIRDTHVIPDAFGTNNRGLAYNSNNKHVYVAPTYCCSCGSSDRDLEVCPDISSPSVRYSGNVLMKTGKDAGETMTAVCGEICNGSTADDGVTEFNQIQSSTTYVNSVTWAKPIDPRTGKNLMGHTIISAQGFVFVMDDESITLLEPSANPLEASTVVGSYKFGNDEVTDLAVAPRLESTKDHVIFTLKGGKTIVIRLKSFPSRFTVVTEDGEGASQVEHIPGTTKFYLQQDDKISLYEIKGKDLDAEKLDSVNTVSDFILHVDNYKVKEQMRDVNFELEDIEEDISFYEKKTEKTVKKLIKKHFADS